MKKLMRTFALMAAATLGLSACTGEKLVPDNGNADGKLVTVHFGAEASIEGATKATLTPNEAETMFASAWDNGDALSVKYSFDYGATKETTATWSAEKSCFEAQMDGGKGDWTYDALYPAPNAEKKVDFGSARTQNGSAYNSKFDLMKGIATAENADAGKTADGKDVVFNMERQTAIAYFHFKSTLDEEVVSAKLSVEGATAYLSTSEVKANEDYAKGYAFTKTEGVASKEINLTFDAGTAPKTSDFKLWFNVLPTDYDKMTLTVETANHTLTISRNAKAADKYEAGKLYKVVKDNIPAEKWVEKVTVPVYASVAELIAAGKPTKDATKVTVTLTDEEIIRFHTLKDGTVAGAIIKVGTQEVEIFCKGTPSNWKIGGTISGTLTNCDWMLFYSTWELCPADYSELTYKAPLPTCATPVITIAEGGVVSIACETPGATIHYTVGDTPADPTETDAVFSAVTLTEGQTIKAIAVAEGFKQSAVASKKYTVGGSSGSITIMKKISEISGTTTNGTKVSSMKMDDVVTLSASTKGNNGKVYIKNGITDWRLYQFDQGTMTVTSKAGYVIESITITFTNSNSGTLLYNNNVVTSGKAVEVSGSSVKFTLGNSGTAKNGQIKVTAISVTYKQQ